MSEEEEPEVVLLDSAEAADQARAVQPYRPPLHRRLWAQLRRLAAGLWRRARRLPPRRPHIDLASDEESAAAELRRRTETAWMGAEEDVDKLAADISERLAAAMRRALWDSVRRYERDAVKQQHEIFRLQIALAKAREMAEEQQK